MNRFLNILKITYAIIMIFIIAPWVVIFIFESINNFENALRTIMTPLMIAFAIGVIAIVLCFHVLISKFYRFLRRNCNG